jgi:hypothetical protein
MESITRRYVDFMVSCIGESTEVFLSNPDKDYMKIDHTFAKLKVPVDITVLDKYTRSIKLKLKFDRYEHEGIFYMPVESSPLSNLSKLDKNITKIVNDAYIKDGREDEIREMYKQERGEFANYLNEALVNIKKDHHE